jgi:hypothetical protein
MDEDVLDMMDDGRPSLPSSIDLDSFMAGRHPRKYKKACGKWTRSERGNFSNHHLDVLAAPLELLLKILSGNVIEVAAMVITRVLYRAVDVHKEIESNTVDKKMLDSVKAFMTPNVKCGRTMKELTEAQSAILSACMFSGDVNKVTIRIVSEFRSAE